MQDPLRISGGFADLVGYELITWEADRVELALTVAPQHLNRSGVMHGGVLSTLIDSACGHAGCYSPEGEKPRRAFTLSLNSAFIATAQLGNRLTVTAHQSGGGKSVFFADCEVRDQDGRMIGRGDGVFKYLTLSPSKSR